MTYERRIQLLALAAGLPGSFIALLLLWTGSYSSGTAWTLSFLIAIFWIGFAVSLQHRVIFSLQTLSNILAAMREEDFSMRGRGARRDDAMGEVMIEVNALSETLRSQRLGALEATALLRAVMEEIDLAVFTFDNNSQLRLVNRAGERLLGRPEEQLLGFTAAQLGLGTCLDGEAARTMELSFPGGSGRWGLRRGSFRQGGLPHQLVVLSDLSRTLRDEERKAWQRLIRVLGHELNNSLAPIQSVAQGLESGLQSALKAPRQPEQVDASDESTTAILDDLRQGLGIIRSRTEALSRFMAAYARLARLPQPKHAPMDVAAWINRTAKLETRLKVTVAEGPPVVISADADQLEQLLINIIRNAADAALECKGGVEVGWTRQNAQLDVWVLDEGPGLPNTSNLFVPFFTTKPGGSGIGLVLSRQIAEAHGGELTLKNRADFHGCEARLRLPV
ncbi:MAG: PAS domain-containing sensor histidine kinase [Proteobacteria bacterium]|nr:MAG: PAS domain-containing sensor histidine kinase [Pseudomonadota bacterium]